MSGWRRPSAIAVTRGTTPADRGEDRGELVLLAPGSYSSRGRRVRLPFVAEAFGLLRLEAENQVKVAAIVQVLLIAQRAATPNVPETWRGRVPRRASAAAWSFGRTGPLNWRRFTVEGDSGSALKSEPSTSARSSPNRGSVARSCSRPARRAS